MAPLQWSNLPGDILSIILKLLDSDLHLLRLRSVCSSWRSSLPNRFNPISFPLDLPPISPNSLVQRLSLNFTTLYRLSPPSDSSHAWLFRVLQVNPNSFSLLTPLLPIKIKGIIPQSLKLLDHRITEICKCYAIDGLDLVRKVLVLWNYGFGCEFIVLALVSDRNLHYWKLGDSNWTRIDTGKYCFDDLILFDGKCYGIGWRGELVCFDSEFKLNVAVPVSECLAHNYNNFVVYKSDLYVVSKIYDQEPDELSSEFEDEVTNASGVFSDEDEDEDEDEEISVEEEEADPADIPLRMKVFRMCDDGWVYCRGLKEDEIFLSSFDVNVGISAKDFGQCKGNCVYVAHKRHEAYDLCIEYGNHHGVYDFDGRRTRTLILNRGHERANIYWLYD